MDLPMQPFSLKIAKLKLYFRYVIMVDFLLFGATFLWVLTSCEGTGKTGCELTWLSDLINRKKVQSGHDVMLMAIYRVASLLTMGGVGDVNPHTTTERLLAVIFMLLGYWGCGYLQAIITSQIRTVANEQDVHTTKVAEFVSCLKANGVNEECIGDVIKYVEHD